MDRRGAQVGQWARPTAPGSVAYLALGRDLPLGPLQSFLAFVFVLFDYLFLFYHSTREMSLLESTSLSGAQLD